MRVTGAILITAVAALACGGDGGTNPGGCTSSATQICLTASSFNPPTLTVASGTAVTWRDGSGIAHTVTSNSGTPEAFDQSVAGGGTFTRQFNATGTYGYHCDIHAGMNGTLTVN